MISDKNTKNRYTYVTLFSSAGIGCYGLKKVGFECVATNEYLEKRMNIQRANKKCKYDSGYITGDIKTDEVKNKIFAEIDKWKNTENISDIDLVFATPPCQGMSTANVFKKDETSRNSLITEAVKIIKTINPKIFVFENVQAFMGTECTDDNGELVTIQSYIFGHLSENYNVAYKVINFRHRGIPQNRVRCIVIGTRKDLTEISPYNLFPAKQNEITLREIIGDYEHLEPGQHSEKDMLHFAKPLQAHYLEWMNMIKEGESIFDVPGFENYVLDENGVRQYVDSKIVSARFRRVEWDKPGHALTRNNGAPNTTNTIHPVDNRVFSISEIMKIDTIPDDFKWTDDQSYYEDNPQLWAEFIKKNENNIRECVGEAVPTHVMEQIGMNIIRMLEFQKYVDTGENTNNTNPYILLKKLFDKKFGIEKYKSQSQIFNELKNVSCYNFINDKLYFILSPENICLSLQQLSFVLEETENVWIDVVCKDMQILKFVYCCINIIPIGRNINISFFVGDTATHRNKKMYNIYNLQRITYEQLISNR